MYVIEPAEMTVLTGRLRTLGANNLALLYLEALGEDASHTLTQPPLKTVVELINRIGFSVDAVMATCDWLAKTFANAPETPGIVKISTRLRAQAAQAPEDPEDEIWIEAEPMVNRVDLRGLLREICKGQVAHSVVYVVGGTASGRTHSKHLIGHVAEKRGIRWDIADFQTKTEARNLLHLADQLKDAYGLGTLTFPVSTGSTPGEVASSFAEAFRRKLRTMEPGEKRPWVVIDFTDEVVETAVADFITIHCTHRLRAEFRNCVLFVLGPHSLLETLNGNPNLSVERLGRLTRSEIETAARVINHRGRKPLVPDDLVIRIDAIDGLVSGMPEDQQNAEIRTMLLGLRQEVHAP